MTDNTYSPAVYRAQGGNSLIVTADGTITVAGTLDCTSATLIGIPEKGDTGSQGVQGSIGSQGDVGEQGSQGSTGSQGSQGSQGAAGTSANLPNHPTDDGDYVLHISSGVATWISAI